MTIALAPKANTMRGLILYKGPITNKLGKKTIKNDCYVKHQNSIVEFAE
jgi:hypothetical protein